MTQDFVIENGVLMKYTGAGDDVVIPDSVKKIDKWAFSKCEALKAFYVENNPYFTAKDGVLYEVNKKGELSLFYIPPGKEGVFVLPTNIKKIRQYVFHNTRLSRLYIPKGATVLPRPSDYYFSSLKVVFEEGYAQTKEKISADYVNEVPVDNARDCAYIALYQFVKKWTERVISYMGESTENSNAVVREILEILGEETNEQVIEKSLETVMLSLEVIDHDLLKAYYDLLNEKQASGVLKELSKDKRAHAILFGTKNDGDTEETSECSNPIEEEVKSLWQINDSTAKLADIITKGIRYRDSNEICSAQVLKYVIASYAQQQAGANRCRSECDLEYVEVVFQEDADRIAEALNREDLQEVLETLAFNEKPWENGYIIPFARFASPQQISKLISFIGKWAKGANMERFAAKVARGALLLSDTREAMMASDKDGTFTCYAAMRGKDTEILRDTILSDFGFGANGEKAYDLGANTVIVRVNDELQLDLYDNNAGKTVKSIPKKNADPALYDLAKADFADLKKNIGKVYKNRKKLLFRAFLSGKEFAPNHWTAFYRGNPVLAAITRLLVWQQGDAFFTLKQGITVDHDEREYSLDDQKQIRLAYPTEMNSDETAAWQNYFMKNDLKQPFAQVWEPVYDPNEIGKDRYYGCKLPILRFNNKDDHGIRMVDLSSYSETFDLQLTDCELECEPSVGRFVFGVTDDAVYELKDFTINTFSRYANHIVSLLDKWTIEDRIKRDDTSIISALSGSTIVQIKDYIETAGQNNATGCQAALLEYMHQHFETFDPLAEYLLEED